VKRSPAMWAEIRGGQDGFRAVGAWDTQAFDHGFRSGVNDCSSLNTISALSERRLASAAFLSRAAHRGRVITAEHRAAISQKLMGHKQSPEQIEKRMKKLRGRKRPASACDASRAFMLGRKLPADHCQNIGKSKAKLADDQVREVRELRAAGVPRKDLAVRFNIDAASITQIVKRTSYRWVS